MIINKIKKNDAQQPIAECFRMVNFGMLANKNYEIGATVPGGEKKKRYGYGELYSY